MVLLRLLLAAGAVLAALVLLPAPATAASERRPVQVDVRVQSFALQGRRVVAKGVARAGLRDGSGNIQQVSKKVFLQVKGGGSCKVLTLQLDDLQLTLLGLKVDTSAVNLRITGERKGGALGQLFCKLATGLRLDKSLLARQATRSLNRSLRGKPMRVMSFRAHAAPTAEPAQAPTPGCQVLDLLLGPLDLDLLGLRVNLYGETTTRPVRVLITADPNGGVLGQVFCRLARGEANP